MFQAGADVNAGSPAITPLMLAASYGFTCGIKCLLEAGADANIVGEVSFCTLLKLLVVTLVDLLSLLRMA